MASNVFEPGDSWRPLLPKEQRLLEALTGLPFTGAAELRAQIPFTTAQQGCGCGCSTINLDVDQGRAAAAPVTRNPVPGEAVLRPPKGGGLILFARGGYLSCLEIFTWQDEPLQLPEVAEIRTYIADPPAPPLGPPDSV